MTTLSWAVPSGLLMGFLLSLFVLAACAVRAHLHRVHAAADKDDALVRGYHALRTAVDATITELESYPATYRDFPQSLRDLLQDAHNAAYSASKGREIG